MSPLFSLPQRWRYDFLFSPSGEGMWQTSSAGCPLGLLGAFCQVFPGIELCMSYYFALSLPCLFLFLPSLSWAYTFQIKCQNLNGVPQCLLSSLELKQRLINTHVLHVPDPIHSISDILINLILTTNQWGIIIIPISILQLRKLGYRKVKSF